MTITASREVRDLFSGAHLDGGDVARLTDDELCDALAVAQNGDTDGERTSVGFAQVVVVRHELRVRVDQYRAGGRLEGLTGGVRPAAPEDYRAVFAAAWGW